MNLVLKLVCIRKNHVFSCVHLYSNELPCYFFIFLFLEKEDCPRPLHLGDACSRFINYSERPYKALH